MYVLLSKHAQVCSVRARKNFPRRVIGACIHMLTVHLKVFYEYGLIGNQSPYQTSVNRRGALLKHSCIGAGFSSVEIRIHESSILGFVVCSNELRIRFEYFSRFVRTNIRNVSYPQITSRSLYFRHFARILTFYDYWHSKTRIWLDFECLSSSHHQTLKIRIMIRMRITNILYESTRVRTTNPSKPQKDSRIRRIYSNYESSNINTSNNVMSKFVF